MGALFFLIWLPDLAGGEPPSPPDVEFNRQVRPILAEKCFRCHGPDRAKRRADLRLDLRDAALAPGTERPALVPGQPQQSEAYRRITASEERERMPPVRSGLKLTAQEIDILRRWIEQGAPYQPHWSLLAPRSPPLPRVRLSGWAKNPLDLFVLARLEQEGLRPSPEASRTTCLRRVSLDLIGLPPTPAEVDAFRADTSADAYEKVVDRLLRSPRYGERRALDWLDAARYADTNGYFSDHEHSLWRWRDWVIDAFNQNKPFDQFTIEQLAGDLLPGATQDQLIATGFNRNHMVSNESGIIDEEYRVEYVADRTETTATVWLGLTVGCARCHDHKYDSITQKEYYQFFAFFNNVPEQGLIKEANPPPVLSVPTPAQQRARVELRRRRADAERQVKLLEPALRSALARWEATAAGGLEPAPSEGLIAHHDFDQQRLAGHPDESGLVRYALVLDGRRPTELAGGPDLHTSWAFSLWLRADSAPSGGVGVLSRVDPQDGGRGFELVWKGAHLAARLLPGHSQDALEVSTGRTLTTGEWHHVAVTCDGSGEATRLRLFVDGVGQGEIQADSLAGKPGVRAPWRLGWRLGGMGFAGRIDELRFYRRPLSVEEVSSLYWNDLTRSILATPADKRSPRQKEQLLNYYAARHAPAEARSAWQRRKRIRQQQDELQAAIPTTLVMQEMDRPRPAFVLLRGQYDKHGSRVDADVPHVLPPLPPGAPRNRLGLARWLVSPSHPLTARVAVNRFWQHLFGAGLVKTVNDFGSQGDWPSHPELLDWLAVRFVQDGWDVKALHRLLVLSATYRQSSDATPELLRRDPDNRLLARGPRFRLPAEVIRDQALAVSGLLVEKAGGPSVKPYQPSGLWEAVSYNADLTYVPDRGAGRYRRSLYTFWKRQAPPPAMLCFDGPTRETCIVKRQRTNTPLQALVLLNDPTFVEAARALAARAIRQTDSPAARISYAFRCVLGRAPHADEVEPLLRLLGQQRDEYRRKPQAARKLLGVGPSPCDKDLDPAELAALTTVANVLLNLDETITKP